MLKIGSAAELAAQTAYDAALAHFDRLIGVHLWLIAAASATPDRAEREHVHALARRCEAEVDAANAAWLTARRAWADVAGIDLEPVNGI